jgi:hypothetical protein
MRVANLSETIVILFELGGCILTEQLMYLVASGVGIGGEQ